MSIRKRHSILFRTITSLIGVTCLVGALFIAVSASIARDKALSQTRQRLGELLDTVESTLRVACFTSDKVLAKEVAQGLLRSSEVRRVVIHAGDKILVDMAVEEDKPGDPFPGPALRNFRREVASPFDSLNQVGDVELEPNPEWIDAFVSGEARNVTFLLGIQLLVISLVALGCMLYLIVRPIKVMSDALHRFDPVNGDRLPIPAGHAGDELGRLAGDINELAGRLVDALRQEQALRLQRETNERKYHNIFENADSGIFVADIQGRLVSWNSAFARMVDLQVAVPDAGEPEPQWKVPHGFLALLNNCLETWSQQTADFQWFLGNGDVRWLNFTLSAVGDAQVQGIVSDITQRKQMEISARNSAYVDALTGLGNRFGLEQMVSRHLESAPEEDFSLFYIDLDGFRRINEALGLPTGDRILRAATGRLQEALPDGTWIARLGGDDFAAVVHGERDDGVLQGAANQVLHALGAPFETGEQPAYLGASLGIACYPQHGRDVASLLRNAEMARNAAQQAGGRCLRFFHHSMIEEAEARRRLESELREAIASHQLCLHYQPIVDLQQKRMVGVEALVRWQHPVRGLIFPDQFIPVAEETGLIGDLGLWVLQEACHQLHDWRKQGLNLYASVNVSVRQIPEDLPVETVLQAIRRADVPPESLVLEITEGVLMTDISHGRDWLHALRDAGFRTYLDDFGTGYSSLSYLKRFPLDTVKIDKSFVRDMNEDRSDAVLIQAIVMMTGSLGLKVVAEGVEDQAQLNRLATIGCRYVQGYYFSRPVPPGQIPALYEDIPCKLQVEAAT